MERRYQRLGKRSADQAAAKCKDVAENSVKRTAARSKWKRNVNTRVEARDEAEAAPI